MAKVEKKQKGTEEMPEPELVNYETYYRVNDIFVNDLKVCLGDMAYVEVQKYLNFLSNYNNILPVASLNEMIRMLGNEPFRMVNPLMVALNNSENFNKYFTQLDLSKKEEQPANEEKESK